MTYREMFDRDLIIVYGCDAKRIRNLSDDQIIDRFVCNAIPCSVGCSGCFLDDQKAVKLLRMEYDGKPFLYHCKDLAQRSGLLIPSDKEDFEESEPDNTETNNEAYGISW